MNRLFVAYKPSGIGSNLFLSKLKRKYGVKKAGFSGTLDPFAKGVLLVGFGTYTKLFRFLNKTPKRYRATLWLGAKSISLDTEMVEQVDILQPFDTNDVADALKALEGELYYKPPIFSAKRINGKRAYDLARAGEDVELNTVKSTIYDIELLHYCHPFVTFEATVSEGTYIRSLGAIVAEKLGVSGCLSALERLNEGQFYYENERPLDIKKALHVEQNYYLGDAQNINYGRVLHKEDFKIQKNGTYFIDNGDFISIITIKDEEVKYELGRVPC